MRTSLLAALAAAGLLAAGACPAARAQGQQPPAQAQGPAPTTAAGLQTTRARAEQKGSECQQAQDRLASGAGGQQVSPEQRQQILAQAGCGPTKAELDQVQRENHDMEEMYDRLMKESADDLKDMSPDQRRLFEQEQQQEREQLQQPR